MNVSSWPTFWICNRISRHNEVWSSTVWRNPHFSTKITPAWLAVLCLFVTCMVNFRPTVGCWIIHFTSLKALTPMLTCAPLWCDSSQFKTPWPSFRQRTRLRLRSDRSLIVASDASLLPVRVTCVLCVCDELVKVVLGSGQYLENRTLSWRVECAL